MESVYRQLQRKLNTIGVGVPESEKGYDVEYLKALFTEEEAEFALKMDVGLHTLEEVAQSMGISPEEAQRMLTTMSKHGLVYHVADKDGVVRYYLCSSYHGFFEWNVGRADPAWIKPMVKHNMAGMTKVFFNSEVPLFRYLPIRPDLVEDGECLDIDNIENIIRRQKRIAVVSCFCKVTSKTFGGKHVCKAAPHDNYATCLAFGEFVDFYIDELEIGREITADEALEIMSHSSKRRTAPMVLNDKNVEGMCNCCPCCCGVVGGLRAFGAGKAREALSNYASVWDESLCGHCGTCAERCPTAARKLVHGEMVFDPDRCFGCGLCVDTCKDKALKLFRKPEGKLFYPPDQCYTELLDNIAKHRRKTRLI